MPESIFQTFLNRLNDLSSKNRLLYLPRLEGFGMVDVRDFDFLTGEPAFEIIRKLIQGKKEIPLIPEIDPRMGESNQLAKRLARLAVRDQLTLEETGEQSLYLTWLFAEGKLPNGQVLRAPVLLKPISLERKNGIWTLVCSDSWQWNPAFLLIWRHAVKSTSSDWVSDEMLEELTTDPTEFRTQLNKLIQDHFSIQVQSNLFEDQIQPFPISQISLDEERMEEGRIALRPYAVLGQFAQKSSFLFSDYEELIQDHEDKSLEDFFQTFFTQNENLIPVREENMFPVFSLDASQENVLLKVRQGKSLVVEGPPGTGKSQLIANLVSDFIARGKKVLVVSQKRAALDVVFERMAQKGFGDFLALVHDFQGDQKSLFEKLKKQIDSIESFKEQNRGIDSIQLEREISILSRTISNLSEKFEEFRKALFSDHAAGIPIKAMYLNVDLNEQALKSSELIRMDFEQARQFEKNYQVFKNYQDRYSKSFWANRRSFAGLNPRDYGLLSQTLHGIDAFRNSIPHRFPKNRILSVLEEILIRDGISTKVSDFLELWKNQLDKASTLQLIFSKSEQKKLSKVSAFLKRALEAHQSFQFEFQGELLANLQELEFLLPKSRSFFGKLQAKWKKTSYPLIFGLLERNGRRFEESILLEIQDELRSKIKIQEDFRSLPESTVLKLSGDFSKDFNSVSAYLNLFEAWSQLPELHSVLEWKSLGVTDFQESLIELEELILAFEKEKFSWQSYLSKQQIISLFDHGLESNFPENPLNWNSVFGDLSDFDRFLESWNHRDLGQKLWEDYPEESLQTQLKIFWNGWNLFWIEEIERRNPVLSEAGSLKFSREMEELKTAILEKRKISGYMTLLRLREQVSEHLEYNRLGNRLTYRDLHHQVSKKRQQWPIRKLVQEFGEEVFRLLPCWLGSPETVSAVFPISAHFDLVIFDEASQCPVERGLPAMLRGKQVVVAGDSKQLRPSDFYQVKWESEEEGLEYEAESLLELAGFYFERTSLKGHYRSADPALIYFSNSHFYRGDLETLPDYQISQAGLTPFYWKKVEGIWENQSNLTEADAVLELVKKIQSSSPSDTIGVVTGNYFQMELIREKLWKAGVAETQIKVRNIENVQGDEFDQVILSLGYAPNREGRLITNFGLLGKAGAENRLNVAITRARKKMHVISSVDPEDFRPSQLQNPGIALLREFLAFVKVQGKNRDIPAPEVANPGFEINWSLKNRLLKENSSYSKQIPSAVMDLIFSEGREKKAILTDDQRFFSAPTAKAALAYHPILLESKGWGWEWKWSRRF